jgi:squalene-associated FAD-dependent desaturase
MQTGESPINVHVGIVGGGLAGLAAAVALVEHGCTVELFEARRKLGGRAGSYVDAIDGATIDHCQHVAMGCCTNFLDFCRRAGIASLLERHETLHFFGPDGRRCDLRAWKWLPAPLHLAPPLLGLSYLSAGDKLAIARAMSALVRMSEEVSGSGPTILEWLVAQHQPRAAIERFWKVVLVSALAESLDRASLAAARKVFLDGFLAHPDASDVWAPRVSLDELYDDRVATWLSERGAAIHRESAVAAIDPKPARCLLRLRDGAERSFDFVILAVAWNQLARLLSSDVLNAVDSQGSAASLASAPITSVHLWFDRPLTDLPHAVLIDRLSQWVFRRPASGSAGEHYYQVVISASHDLAGRAKESISNEVLGDLRAVFPEAKSAMLLRTRIITEHNAVFSVRPGLDAIRPSQQTAIRSLLLAGDWTRTGWPATMEGAVRSGYLAAEAILAAIGNPAKLLTPDLPRGWLLRR